MNTYTETVDSAEPLEKPASRVSPTARTAIGVVVVLALLWLASALIPFFIRHTGLEAKLTANISAALGRSVQVGSYDFSFWGGPTLEAQSVSVAEDPRFGAEYFLRAESMSLRLRLAGLLRGRIEPQSLFLDQPTLNLVRDTDGDWNLAEWLPKPGIPGAPESAAPQRSLGSSFRTIDVEGGRINFKRGYDKLPFALVNLSGRAGTTSSGRWQLDFTGTPWRAAVDAQQVGELHASGYIGGTSSRLWPAALQISWSDASLADALRLVRGDDHGIRGEFAAALNAATHSGDGSWTIEAFAQVSQLHRWDLLLRDDNPAVNLRATTNWNPADSSLALNDVRFEAPHSNGRFSVKVVWNAPAIAAKPGVKGKRELKIPPASPPLSINVATAQIGAADALSWLRAFRAGASDAISAQGIFAVQGAVEGWPAQIASADVSSDGIAIGGVAPPVHVGPLHLRLDHGAIALPTVRVAFGSADSALDISSSPTRGSMGSDIELTGSLVDAHALLTATRAFGWDVAHGWDVTGSVRSDLHWQGGAQGDERAWMMQPSGFIEGGSGAMTMLLRTPFLNLPLAGIKARIDLKPGSRHVTISSASAFGGHWTGTLDSDAGNPAWQLSLSADHLAAADLDRWINPRWRESFLDRMLPFLSSGAPVAGQFPGALAAGHIDVAQFMLGTWNFGHLGGHLQIDGRRVQLDDAAAQLYHGGVEGSFAADLGAVPTYAADVTFTRIDISSLTDSLPALSGLFDGAASGEIAIRARGGSRAEALTNLDCSGSARVVSPQLLKIDLPASIDGGEVQTGASRFKAAESDFSCADRTVKLTDLNVISSLIELEGSGTVDFSRNLNVTLRRSDTTQAVPFRLTGTLANPQLAPAAVASRRAR